MKRSYKRHTYTKESVESVVKKSVSWAQVCRELGVPPMSGSQTHLKSRAVKWGIDFSHFTGQAWNRGKVFGPKRPIKYYLRRNAAYSISHRLKERLIKEGIKKAQCEDCGLTEWQGKRAPLELDHLNDDHFDNRLKNLRIRCANCHANKNI